MCQIVTSRSGKYLRLCEQFLKRSGYPAEAVFDKHGVKRLVRFEGPPPVQPRDYSTGMSTHHYSPPPEPREKGGGGS